MDNIVVTLKSEFIPTNVLKSCRNVILLRSWLTTSNLSNCIFSSNGIFLMNNFLQLTTDNQYILSCECKELICYQITKSHKCFCLMIKMKINFGPFLPGDNFYIKSCYHWCIRHINCTNFAMYNSLCLVRTSADID